MFHDDTLQRLLDLMGDLDTARPHGSLPQALDALFQRLAGPLAPADAEAVEEQIWALWCGHEHPAALDLLGNAIDLLGTEQLEAAEAMLDRLVARWPDWAEAWNKRATCRFLREHDRAALADIEQTLLREPRHFGALTGLGQICLRQDHPEAAGFAFRAALRRNPHLESVRQYVSIDAGRCAH